MSSLEFKLNALQELLRDMDKVVIAFSGGVDSTFLLKVATDVLGDNALAVTATSETYPSEELEEAKILADRIKAKQVIITTSELEDERFLNNPPERCYYCKSELFTKIKEIAQEKGIPYIIDGANADDSLDFRPGHKAGKELGVRSPLKEVNLTKDEIRELSKEMDLTTWDKPAFACLASRFPYGLKITGPKLDQVHNAESFMRLKGFHTFRVRHHDNIARIEVKPTDFLKICDEALRLEIISHFKGLGYTYVTLDLIGFRSGSMNEVLSEEIING